MKEKNQLQNFQNENQGLLLKTESFRIVWWTIKNKCGAYGLHRSQTHEAKVLEHGGRNCWLRLKRPERYTGTSLRHRTSQDHLHRGPAGVSITVPTNRAGRLKKRSGGVWIQVWYIWYIGRTFVNATMYPHPGTTIKKKEEKNFTCNSCRGKRPYTVFLTSLIQNYFWHPLW
jgi:hypothetical protein